jgi:hypothetical protein
MVLDSDYNLVSYSFTKIHNFRVEADAPQWEDDVVVDAVRKVNGFMCALSVYKGQLIVSTTGSIDSPFAKLARSHVTSELESFVIHEMDGMTAMFECCDPSDPHIVHEEPGLYFLGMRENVHGSKVSYNPEHGFWNNLGVKTLPVETKTIGEVMADLKVCKHEGFVVYHEDENGAQISTKMKSPHYLTKKLFMRGNLDRLLNSDVKSKIAEEYYPLVDWIEANRDDFSALDEMARREFIEKFLGV